LKTAEAEEEGRNNSTCLTPGVDGPGTAQAAYSDEYFTVEVSTAGCYTVSDFPGGCTCAIIGYTGNCLDDYAEFPASDGDSSFNLTPGTCLIKISNQTASEHGYDMLVDTGTPGACDEI